eukprot:1510085-Amphidinium_carterae.1
MPMGLLLLFLNGPGFGNLGMSSSLRDRTKHSKEMTWDAWSNAVQLWYSCAKRGLLPEDARFDAANLDGLLQTAKEVFESKLHAHRRSWVQDWKKELDVALDPHSVKAFRYVKQADCPPTMFIQTAEGRHIANVDEQDAELRKYWLPIFAPSDLPNEDQLRAHATAFCHDSPHRAFTPSPLSADEMRHAVMKGKSRTSPGFDGWYIHELRRLPDCASMQLA